MIFGGSLPLYTCHRVGLLIQPGHLGPDHNMLGVSPGQVASRYSRRAPVRPRTRCSGSVTLLILPSPHGLSAGLTGVAGSHSCSHRSQDQADSPYLSRFGPVSHRISNAGSGIQALCGAFTFELQLEEPVQLIAVE